jgi:hypothetical protein
MFGNRRPRIGQELLDVPMGDMIRQMAFAIAEAQIRLDENSIEVAEMMGGLRTITDGSGNVTFEDSRVFFGSEKITRSDAVARHNSTNNVLQKAEIREELGAENYLPGKETSYTIDTNGIPTGFSDNEYVDYLGFYYVNQNGAIAKVAYEDFIITHKSAGGNVPAGTDILELPRRISMMELGYTPTFYQFVDTIIEVKISIKYTQEGESSISTTRNNKSSSASLGFGLAKVKAGTSVQTSQVNASYSQKYSYSAEGSSLLRTKLVPVPPPAVFEERIQRLMEEEFKDGDTSQTV